MWSKSITSFPSAPSSACCGATTSGGQVVRYQYVYIYMYLSIYLTIYLSIYKYIYMSYIERERERKRERSEVEEQHFPSVRA